MTAATTNFQTIAARDINTGRPAAMQPHVLTSLAGVFAISFDTLRIIADLLPQANPIRLAA
jgi:hypothetical protein